MVTSFSDNDGVVVGVTVVVVVETKLPLLSTVVEDDVVLEERPDSSTSSSGNDGKESDTLALLFEVDVDSASSSSSSPKGDIPTTLVPSSLLWTSPLSVLPPPAPAPPPPRTLRRMTGPRMRMISPIIELTLSSIL